MDDDGTMGHLEVAQIDYYLPDGPLLLADASFRVGQGATMALVGPNGAGNSTLMRLVVGELQRTLRELREQL